jgi:hypothetical protein
MKWLPVAIIIVSTSAADLLKSLGMRKHGEVHDFRLGAFGNSAPSDCSKLVCHRSRARGCGFVFCIHCFAIRGRAQLRSSRYRC